MMDDSGLAFVSRKGLVVLSGCAHSGICNMIEHARVVTGCQQLDTVIGGFHLRADNMQTRRTLAYLKKLMPGQVLPSHCTMDPALGLFQQAFGSRDLKAGTVVQF
jgi:7,8-dihydropterin-6-yl-methyl-4-(beta-D-ribofuranosyl)aminobenzene 5'-phosphate synthase